MTYTYIVANTNQGVVQRETPRGYYLIDSKTDEETFVNKENIIETSEYMQEKNGKLKLIKQNNIFITITVLSDINTTNSQFDLNKEKPDCFLLVDLPIETVVIKDGKKLKNFLLELKGKPCIKIGEPINEFQKVRTHISGYDSDLIDSIVNVFSMVELLVPVSLLINKKTKLKRFFVNKN